MSRSRTPAAGRTGAAAPRVPRRVSGPVPGRPRPVGVPPRLRGPEPALQPTTGITDRLRAVPDHPWLDTLLRSRAWIWLIGIGLGGIVAMQVSLLEMNAGISRSVERSVALENVNAALSEQVAELSGGERVRKAARDLGLISPDAGTVGFVTVRPEIDAVRAARRMTPPTDEARTLLANRGRPPGTVEPVATAAPAVTAPVATVVPTATPVATVVPTATPVPTAVAPVTTTTAGATTAPTGG